MKLYLECIPCYIRQVIDAAKMVTEDEKLIGCILRKALVAASEFNFDGIGLLTQARIQRAIKDLMPDDDPYCNIKKKFNIICLSLEEELKKIIRESVDPFETSLRISLAGNIIDFGPKKILKESDILDSIREAMNQHIDRSKINLLKDNIESSNKILYIGDNSGEIVFDKIFIESLPKRKITFVVRGGPALNDSTMKDAEMVGMKKIVRVITTGLDMPASILPLCSEEFLKEYEESDLVIAKGMGNYEALSDEDKNIFFLLKVKCPVIVESFNGRHKLGEVVVDSNFNIDKSD
jgi:uncharacterized protein with ATP-grasp and redox domains